MYSVLIQNSSTLRSFEQHISLFMEAVNDNRIGVCKWNEGGTSIDTALPGIAELTNDKKNWRAVIVRLEDDDAMREFESREDNPFDFHENTFADELSESQVPLIRLTHILGGVPRPEIEFEQRLIQKDFEKPVRALVPVENREADEAYMELCKKYEFDGNPPSVILLISARKSYDGAFVKEIQALVRESDSSEFWKNNRYPSICRFMVYDFAKRGPVQKEADEFSFWMSVLLMSLNDEPSDSIQAYKLYRVQASMNKDALEDSFQYSVNRLRAARQTLEKHIYKAADLPDSVESDLPPYQLRVTVDARYTKDMNREKRSERFGVFSTGNAEEMNQWEQSCREDEKRMEHSLRIAGRTLDQTAEGVRSECRFNADEVAELDKYQLEDMEREIDRIYSEIIAIQGRIPSDDGYFTDSLKEAASKVKEELRLRAARPPVFVLVGTAFILLALAKIPAVIDLVANDKGEPLTLAALTAAELLLLIAGAAAALLIQKKRVRKLAAAYNALINEFYMKLTTNAVEQGRYISSIVSHSRGCSYIDLSQRKKLVSDTSISEKYKHIRAINEFISRIRGWTRAFGVDVDFDYSVDDMESMMDISSSPTENTLYTFETGGSYHVPLNTSGEFLDSPFGFAEKLEITREELYDDHS